VTAAASPPSVSCLVLRAAGRSVVLDARGPGLPQVVHWGADLGDLTEADLEALAVAAMPAVARSSYDVAVPLSLLPEQSEGYVGRPALVGSRVPGAGEQLRPVLEHPGKLPALSGSRRRGRPRQRSPCEHQARDRSR